MRHNKLLLFCLCALLSIAAALFSMCAGASSVGLSELFRLISGSGTLSPAAYNILVYVRLPRVGAAYFCGAALAVSGLLLQVSLGNGLAAPSTIGINAGAGFAVVLAGALLPLSMTTRVGAAFLGALAASLLVYALARSTGATSKTTIVLAGVAFTSLLSAGSDAIITFFPDAVWDKTSFSIGGFSGANVDVVLSMLPVLLAGLLGAALLSPRLNLLLLGDEMAASLGLNVRLCRFLSLLCAALLAAAAVSVGGLLSFVGLLVPHGMRLVCGNDYRRLVPFSAVCGGLFLLLCDTLSRILFSPFELPVGILLSFLGAPFFLFLLLRRKERLSL